MQLTALKSGHLAGLQVSPLAANKAAQFFDSVQADNGSAYGTSSSHDATDRSSAAGLLGRVYLGWNNDNPELRAGKDRLIQTGPTGDLFFDFLASQVLHQVSASKESGEQYGLWKTRYNEMMQRTMTMTSQGHEFFSWCNDENNEVIFDGGRLYCTALVAMTLGVYYRHLPIHGKASFSESFLEGAQKTAAFENLLNSNESPKTAEVDASPKQPAGTVARPEDGVQHPDLDKAWADYDAVVSKVTESVKAAIANQFDAATAKGDLDAAEKWQKAQEKFEKAGEVPAETEAKAAVNAAVADYKKAKDDLAKAYESVVKSLTMEKKITEAKAVREEARLLNAGGQAPSPDGNGKKDELPTDRLDKPKRVLVIADPRIEQEAAVRASKKYKLRLEGAKSFSDAINRLDQYDVVMCCSNAMDYWGEKDDRKKPAAFEPVDRFIAKGGHCVIFGAWNGRNMDHLARYGISTGYQHTSFFKPVKGVTEVFLAGAEDLVPADKRLQSTGNFTCASPHTVLLDRDDGRGPALITLPYGKGRLTFSQVEPHWPEDKPSLWIIEATFSWLARGAPIK